MACLLISYTAQNLGDDMFVDYICKRYPNIEFLIVCPREFSKAFLKLPNLRVFHTKKELLANPDPVILQILVGGSLFMEPKNSRDIYTKFISNTQYRIYEDIPMIIIGVNFGPYQTDLHFVLHQSWFASMNYISFRDADSYFLFKNISHKTWAPDILLNYPIPKVKRTRKIVISCIHNNSRIGLPDYDEELYVIWLSDIAQIYINMGYTVLFASFCEKQGDSLAAKKIISRLCKEWVEFISYDGDILTFLSNILSAEYIIGTRFHSIILGWLAGIPVFPISYNEKTENMLKSYGFNGNYSCITSLPSTDFEFVDHNRIMNIGLPDPSLILDARKHFAFLDSFFSEQGASYE